MGNHAEKAPARAEGVAPAKARIGGVRERHRFRMLRANDAGRRAALVSPALAVTRRSRTRWTRKFSNTTFPRRLCMLMVMNLGREGRSRSAIPARGRICRERLVNVRTAGLWRPRSDFSSGDRLRDCEAV